MRAQVTTVGQVVYDGSGLGLTGLSLTGPGIVVCGAAGFGVVAAEALPGDLGLPLRVHVREQRLQQRLLAREVVVEHAGGTSRGRRDVGDLRVEVAALYEQPACRLLERGLRLLGLLGDFSMTIRMTPAPG
jgi:hypothetical protein